MDPMIIKEIITTTREFVKASGILRLIELKLFRGHIARLEAEADNESEMIKQQGRNARKMEDAKFERQYTNLIHTLEKAEPYITTTENKIDDDNDFFWNLVEHSKNISDDSMQTLIAKILAGEYDKPGSYSTITLQILKMMGKKELKLLERLGSLIIDKEQIPHQICTESAYRYMQGEAFLFIDLQFLQSLGLIFPSTVSPYFCFMENTNIKISYFDRQITFEPINKNVSRVNMPPCYIVSNAGKQILQHLNPIFNKRYFAWLKEAYKINNYEAVNT